MKVVKKTWKWSSSRLPTTEKRGYSIYVTSDHSRFWPQDQACTFRHLLRSLLLHPLLLLLEETNKRFLPNVACVGSVSLRFRCKQQGMILKFELSFHFSLGRPKIPFFVVVRSFFALKPHGNACYAGYTQCYMSSPLLFLSSGYTRTTKRMILTHYPRLNFQCHSHTTNTF